VDNAAAPGLMMKSAASMMAMTAATNGTLCSGRMPAFHVNAVANESKASPSAAEMSTVTTSNDARQVARRMIGSPLATMRMRNRKSFMVELTLGTRTPAVQDQLIDSGSLAVMAAFDLTTRINGAKASGFQDFRGRLPEGELTRRTLSAEAIERRTLVFAASAMSAKPVRHTHTIAIVPVLDRVHADQFRPEIDSGIPLDLSIGDAPVS
jgi:hypothetical protein